MRLYSVLLFFICLNVAGYLVNLLIANNVIGNPSVTQTTLPYSGSDVATQFAITTFVMGAAGSGIAGLFALITKQYVYASGATLIWIVGLLINVVTWFTNGFPQLLGFLLGGTGLEGLVSAIFMPILTFYLFFFLAETLSQKPMVS